MKLRLAIATCALVAGAFTLSACGKDSPEPTPTTATPTSAATTTPTTSATISTAADIVGDWVDAKVQWTVHFKDDGTFEEDYQGISGFRVGNYEVTGSEVSLIGGDGNTDKGKVEGTTIVFKLGTLTRK
ncbi:MAG: hypothetical protein ABIR57_11670 [Aeromicrobium sp.]